MKILHKLAISILFFKRCIFSSRLRRNSILRLIFMWHIFCARVCKEVDQQVAMLYSVWNSLNICSLEAQNSQVLWRTNVKLSKLQHKCFAAVTLVIISISLFLSRLWAYLHLQLFSVRNTFYFMNIRQRELQQGVTKLWVECEFLLRCCSIAYGYNSIIIHTYIYGRKYIFILWINVFCCSKYVVVMSLKLFYLILEIISLVWPNSLDQRINRRRVCGFVPFQFNKRKHFLRKSPFVAANRPIARSIVRKDI